MLTRRQISAAIAAQSDVRSGEKKPRTGWRTNAGLGTGKLVGFDQPVDYAMGAATPARRQISAGPFNASGHRRV